MGHVLAMEGEIEKSQKALRRQKEYLRQSLMEAGFGKSLSKEKRNKAGKARGRKGRN